MQLSDHRLLTFDVSIGRPAKELMGMMNLKYVDNWKFVIGVNKALTGIKVIDIDSSDEKVEILLNVIRNIYASALLKRNRRKNNTHWWNGKLESERKRIRTLRRRFQS